LQFHGHTGRYLEPAPGEPSRSLMKMAREGLLHGLRTALHEARRVQSEVVEPDVRVKADGDYVHVNLHVIPLPSLPEGHFLVLFEEASALPSHRRGTQPSKAAKK